MEKTQLELWQKIALFNLDDLDADYPFSKKLMTEQKWSQPLTQRAIAEYKKFMFLVMVEPQGASPSKLVDEVWHLHITFTKNYAEFCEKTIGRFVHHHPSKGGSAEVNRHTDWYKDTLVAYIRHFDTPPAPDIWEYPAHFLPESYLTPQSPFYVPPTEGVLELSHWHDEIQWFKTHAVFQIGLAVLLATLLVFNPFSFNGGDFLRFYGLFAGCALVFNFWLEKQLNQDTLSERDKYLPKNLSTFSLAWFIGGEDRFFQTMLMQAVERKALIAQTGGLWSYNREIAATRFDNPITQVLSCIETSKTYQKETTITTQLLQDMVRPSLTLVERQLNATKQSLFGIKKLHIIGAIVLIVGFLRLLQGVAMGKHVLFLVLLIVGILIMQFVLTTFLKDEVGRHVGQKIVGDITDTSTLLPLTRFAYEGTIPQSSDWATALMFTSVAAINMRMPQNQTDATSCGGSSCSGGDGGGGCGSSCGGCGGCGGD